MSKILRYSNRESTRSSTIESNRHDDSNNPTTEWPTFSVCSSLTGLHCTTFVCDLIKLPVKDKEKHKISWVFFLYMLITSIQVSFLTPSLEASVSVVGDGREICVNGNCTHESHSHFLFSIQCAVSNFLFTGHSHKVQFMLHNYIQTNIIAFSLLFFDICQVKVSTELSQVAWKLVIVCGFSTWSMTERGAKKMLSNFC